MYPQQNILSQTRPRRAWDERLPNGQTIAEMIREKLTSPVTATTEQSANGQQVRYTVPQQQSNDGDYYPNGVRRRAMDERTPSGESVMELGLPSSIREMLTKATIQGQQNTPLKTPASTAITVTKGGYPKLELREIPEAQRRIGEPADQTLRRINLKNDIMGNTGSDQQYRDDLSNPPLRPETPVPEGIQASTGGETRPWKAGYGVGETDPLKREAARIRAMIEYPTSKVNPSGSVDVPHPMSRKKAALLGLLYGLSQGDSRTPLAARLAAGATGATIGGFKPRLIQEGQRRMEVEDAQGHLAQQTKLLTGQEQLEHLRASTEALKQGRKQYVERSDGVYEISKEYPNGRRIGNIPAEVKATKRGSVHYEPREDGLYAVYEGEDGELKAVKVPGVPGKPGSTKESYDITLPDGTVVKGSSSDAIAAANLGGKTTNVRKAKIEESQSLYQKAEALDSEAAKLDEHIKKLEAGKATFYQDPDLPPLPEDIKPFDDQIADLKKQQEAWRKEARDHRIKGDTSRAEGEAIPETVPTPRGRSRGKYAGQRFSRAKVAERAKSLGMTPEQAEKTITDGGGTIY